MGCEPFVHERKLSEKNYFKIQPKNLFSLHSLHILREKYRYCWGYATKWISTCRQPCGVFRVHFEMLFQSDRLDKSFVA